MMAGRMFEGCVYQDLYNCGHITAQERPLRITVRTARKLTINDYKSTQCSGCWNLRASSPHAHQPAVRFLANTSRPL